MQIYDLKGGEINIKLGFFSLHSLVDTVISLIYKELGKISGS